MLSSVYAVLAVVVYIAKLTNKYILLKYNCTRKFFGSSCCIYIIKQLFYSLSSYMSDSRLGATHLVYNKLLDDIFDPDDSRTYKTVCIKCHSTRSLLTLSASSCC